MSSRGSSDSASLHDLVAEVMRTLPAVAAMGGGPATEHTVACLALGDRFREMPDDNSDDRPVIVVHTDHNPDKVRSFYEIPDALAQMIQPDGDSRTLAQCLADLAHPLTRDELWMATEAIGQWLDEDDEGIDKAFPESAKQLKSALAKLEAMLEQATNLDDADE